MKRYYFEPGAVRCYRRRGLAGCLQRGRNVCMGVVRVLVGECSSDSIAKFVLQAALVAALGACVGMAAGCVDFVLAMGIFDAPGTH